MPRNNSSPPPPTVMTWSKASPILIVAGVFDVLRYMFLMFWFFGPALAALYCTVKTSAVVGTTIGGFACTTGAAVVGFYGAPIFAAFGTIMAMATALAGFLTVFLLLAIMNSRVFKEPTTILWALFGLTISITVTVWRLYSAQIKTEKAAYKKWEKETAEARQREQQQAAAMQMQRAQIAQAEQQYETQYEEQTEQDEQSVNGELPQEEDPAHIQLKEIPSLQSQPPPLPSEYTRSFPPPLPGTHLPPPFTPEYGAPREKWNPNSGTPPPMTSEYGYQTTPPPLPQMPMHPPPLSPPLPPQSVRYTNTSGMKERLTINTDERSVEQVVRRNNVFIVHTLAEGEVQHHNENSNVSEKATYGDDIDIMLAFEPSVSASSVTPGQKSRLWSPSGFLLAGGQIGEVGGSDIGSGANGIKSRGGKDSSVEQIDDFIGRSGKKHEDIYKQHGSHGMNEAVVNNPEVFGFFQQVEKDEDGRYWAYSLNIKKQGADAKKNPWEYIPSKGKRPSGYVEVFQNNVRKYRERFSTAQERGVPLYVMTPDREVYACLGVNDDGTVEIGGRLRPEDVVSGQAGWSEEKRKEVGGKLLEKRIFRGESVQKEAEEIIKSL